eukprot:1706738-Rhodomonas_salina.1
MILSNVPHRARPLDAVPSPPPTRRAPPSCPASPHWRVTARPPCAAADGALAGSAKQQQQKESNRMHA